MTNYAATIADSGGRYLAAVDKVHAASTMLSERIESVAGDAFGRLPEQVRSVLPSPHHVLSFNRRITGQVVELHKAVVTNVLDRLPQQQG
jgi:hypothetical protein